MGYIHDPTYVTVESEDVAKRLVKAFQDAGLTTSKLSTHRHKMDPLSDIINTTAYETLDFSVSDPASGKKMDISVVAQDAWADGFMLTGRVVKVRGASHASHTENFNVEAKNCPDDSKMNLAMQGPPEDLTDTVATNIIKAIKAPAAK